MADMVWEGVKLLSKGTKTSSSNDRQKIRDASDHKELERIKQNIQKATSVHSELSVHSFQPKTEILVNRIIDAFSHQKSRLREVQKDANAEKQAKSEALEKVRSLEQRIIREKQEYEAHLRSTQTDYDRRLQNEALAHSRVVDELKKSFQTERQRAQLAYDSELQQKQLMIEELKQDLYDQKEQVKGLADRDLTSRFKTISKSIEEFSRLDWDPSREATWPYSEDELRNFHRNPRRLKQQIVQNCIWLMLNEIIFRTPFRIIGEHGRQFDAELYAFNSPAFEALDEAAAQDYNEKRYKNAEVFLAAFHSTEPRSVNDTTIMQSYTAARLAGMTHISNTLSNIAAIDQRDKDKLDKILHDATKIWLEACTQRYRCFVIIPDDCIDVLKTQEATVPLRLVTKPELQRFGNLRGSDLSQGEVLAGWKSEVETYSIYH